MCVCVCVYVTRASHRVAAIFANSLFAKTERDRRFSPLPPPRLPLVPAASFTRGAAIARDAPKKWDIISGFLECCFLEFPVVLPHLRSRYPGVSGLCGSVEIFDFSSNYNERYREGGRERRRERRRKRKR